MAAGDRYKNGKPKDIVKHAKRGDGVDKTVCGRVSPGYATDDWSDVTCLKCLRRRRIAVERILKLSSLT